MTTLNKIREALEDRNIQEISRKTGIPRYQFDKIKSGDENVKYPIVEQIAKYLGLA